MMIPYQIGGVTYTRKMCLEYLIACQNVLFSSNRKLAAGMNFAICYFVDATKHLIDEEAPFDAADKKRRDEWNTFFLKASTPLLKSSGLGDKLGVFPEKDGEEP